MRAKGLIIGLVLTTAVLFFAFIVKPAISRKKTEPAKAKISVKTAAPAKAGAKRPISKDKGLITIRVSDSKKTNMAVRMRAFRVADSRSSVYSAALNSNKAEELLAGKYDIVLETTPPKIYKGVKVSKGKENIVNLGTITGSIRVAALDARGKNANYRIKILYPKSASPVTDTMTNRAVELIPGRYDIEIQTSPSQVKKDLKVVVGKETVIELGCATGILLVKATDTNGKRSSYGITIRKAGSGEVVASAVTNRALELLEGSYSVEVSSRTAPIKKDFKINAGTETIVELAVPAAPPPKSVKKKK